MCDGNARILIRIVNGIWEVEVIGVGLLHTI